MYRSGENSEPQGRVKGAYHVAKSPGISVESQMNSTFPENPLGNCGLPPEVVLFFRPERNGGNYLTIC